MLLCVNEPLSLCCSCFSAAVCSIRARLLLYPRCNCCFIYLFISSFQTQGNPNKRQQNKSISTPHIHAEYYGNKTSPLTGINPHQSPVWCLRGGHWLKGLVSMYGLSYVSVVSLIRVFFVSALTGGSQLIKNQWQQQSWETKAPGPTVADLHEH